MQKRCSLTAFSASSITRVPLHFSNRHTLFLVSSKYINNKRKTFLLSLTSFARFNSRWALASISRTQEFGEVLALLNQYFGVSRSSLTTVLLMKRKLNCWRLKLQSILSCFLEICDKLIASWRWVAILSALNFWMILLQHLKHFWCFTLFPGSTLQLG